MNTLDSLYAVLKEKIEKMLNEESIELIDMKLSFYAGDYTLRCLVDYTNGGIAIDKCVAINKEIVKFLEEDNTLGASFIVEVNSPGLDRSLKTYKDFARIKGKVVGVWLKMPVDEKTYLEGRIEDVTGQGLTMETKNKKCNIDFVNINVGKEKLDL